MTQTRIFLPVRTDGLVFRLAQCRQFPWLEILESSSHYRVRKDCSSGYMDTDRVFEMSPDTAGLVQSTVLEAPVPFDASLLLPLMLDRTLAYTLSLMDPGSDGADAGAAFQPAFIFTDSSVEAGAPVPGCIFLL